MMKPLHIRCHIQPCHWLSDRKWLEERLGNLFPSAFPWQALAKAGVPLQFGSDSPIEPASFFFNWEALEKSPEAGIKQLTQDPTPFFLYKDSDSVPGITTIENHQIKGVQFDGRLVYS